ncbi:MAG: hypothetical protein AAGJ32_00630 [Pseudomonadota bacterium]
MAVPALALGLLFGCVAPAGSELAQSSTSPGAQAATPEAEPEDKPQPITVSAWQEALVSVTDLDRTARFFLEIGSYETVWRGPVSAGDLSQFGLPETASGEALLLRAPGSVDGYIRLVRFDGAGPKQPTRPGARAWDTGCFWSIMVRMKDMQSAYDDAIAMGWWTETQIAPLSFNGSELNIVVFKGPDGVQVQAYERLNRPTPEGYPPFARMGQPFNIMQMTRDRDAARRLMVDVLGFDTFWFGPPQTSDGPTLMPLGIPQNLTPSVPYKAGIFSPPTQAISGRMEYIEIDGLEGFDLADRCKVPNLGTLSVSYPVDNVEEAQARITDRGWPIERGPYTVDRPPYGTLTAFVIKAPDGAEIEFYESKTAE